ncbi:MAG: hypothetical protein RLZZ241_1525 [Bacteroidota bacterium]|jgi:regulatory protein
MNTFGYKSFTVDEATKRMERYCAYQDRCHQEVVRKLYEMRMIPEAIDSILVHLIDHNFLNEERFALAFTNGKFRQKQWGKLRIRRELKMKGISEYLIRKALSGIPENEYLEVLDQIFEKKTAEWSYKKQEDILRKLYAYLTYRGWENELIYDRFSNLGPKG